MAPEPSVFISYSRKDYYFAESLAFHLLRRGVAAWMDVKDLQAGNDWERDLERALDTASVLLLVVSPGSMSSERVRSEWQRALQRGCRIILVRFRGASLPAELQPHDVVDFRRSFGRALKQLMAHFEADAPGVIPARKASGIGASWRPPLPPWVGFMTLTLAVPLLAYFLMAQWDVDPGSNDRYLLMATAPIAVSGLAWFFCVAFLRRRMGMTRLALCLVCLALVIALPMLKYLFGGASSLTGYDASIAVVVRDHWRQGLLLCAVPVIGLGVLLLARPEDLLRWTPTGKAWANYRVGHVANAVFGRAELAFRFEQIKSFALEHDPADAPMAERLRRQLVSLGGTEAALDGRNATPVLLLTGRTQLGWIDQQIRQLRGAGVTVVGTGIDLPRNLDWLWRRQWIDFRGWDVGRSDRALALPQVPDAVTQPRTPANVTRVHHVLCAVAGLVFTFGGALMPQAEQRTSTMTGPELLAYATMAIGMWWGVLAHRLLKRIRTAARFSRDSRIGWIATAPIVCIDGYALMNDKLGFGRILLAVAFLVTAWVWLSRQRDALYFWFPQDNATRETKRGMLGQSRNWRTLLWTFVYLALWMWTLGLLVD